MFTEELKLIKETEDDAERLRKDARAEAKSIVQEADRTAAKVLADAASQAKTRYDALIAEGQDIAQRQYEEAIRGAREQCSEMAKAAETQKPEIVRTIVERIVKASVNY